MQSSSRPTRTNTAPCRPPAGGASPAPGTPATGAVSAASIPPEAAVWTAHGGKRSSQSWASCSGVLPNIGSTGSSSVSGSTARPTHRLLSDAGVAEQEEQVRAPVVDRQRQRLEAHEGPRGMEEAPSDAARPPRFRRLTRRWRHTGSAANPVAAKMVTVAGRLSIGAVKVSACTRATAPIEPTSLLLRYRQRTRRTSAACREGETCCQWDGLAYRQGEWCAVSLLWLIGTEPGKTRRTPSELVARALL